MFVTTANDASTIPRPLLDRMEVIEVMGYTEEEKVQIAKQFLIPKKLEEHGLAKKDLRISETAVCVTSKERSPTSAARRRARSSPLATAARIR